MKTYRRIEISAFQRRVTVVSGEWSRNASHEQPAQLEETVSLDQTDSTDSYEPIAPESPEGQRIIVEAVRSLEQRLSPEGRALLCAGQNAVGPGRSNLRRFCSRLRSFFQPSSLHLSLNESPAVKQSVED